MLSFLGNSTVYKVFRSISEFITEQTGNLERLDIGKCRLCGKTEVLNY